MAAQKGRAMVVNKDGSVIIGGMNCSVSVEGAIIEYETWEMDGPGREYDGKDVSIQLEGVIDTSDTGAIAILTAKNDETKLDDISVVTGWGTFTGTFVVESAELSGAIGEMQQFTASLKSDNGYTFTPA